MMQKNFSFLVKKVKNVFVFVVDDSQMHTHTLTHTHTNTHTHSLSHTHTQTNTHTHFRSLTHSFIYI